MEEYKYKVTGDKLRLKAITSNVAKVMILLIKDLYDYLLILHLLQMLFKMQSVQ